MHITV